MSDDSIQDLKQFIATLVSQEVSDIRSDIKNLDDKLSTKIDNLSKSVAEAIDNTNEASDAQLEGHEQRIIQLEQKTA